MSYHLEGTFLEVCDCNVICPCWVNETPDDDECQGLIAWNIASGVIDGNDVSGLSIASLSRHSGDRAHGGWEVVFFVDERSSAEQQKALVDVFSGRKGGPLADFAQLTSEILGIERVPIDLSFDNANARLKVGEGVRARSTTLVGANDSLTTLRNSALSKVLSPVGYVGKAVRFKVELPPYHFDIDLEDTSATKGRFSYQVASGDRDEE